MTTSFICSISGGSYPILQLKLFLEHDPLKLKLNNKTTTAPTIIFVVMGELVISKTDGIYIMTDDDVFEINDSIKNSILQSEDSFFMENTSEDDEYIEDGKSVLSMNKEQTQIIKEILKNV